MSNINCVQYIVYKMTAPTGRSYVGMSKRPLSVRRRQHERLAKFGSPLPVHRAIRRYGDEAAWTILAVVQTHDEATALEKTYIKQYDTLKNGYNLTSGGDGVVGRTLSREEKRRLSLAHRHQRVSPEAKRAMSESRSGTKNWKHAGRVCTPQGIFESYTHASEILNVPRSTISRRCHSKSETWKNWYLERNPK